MWRGGEELIDLEADSTLGATPSWERLGECGEALCRRWQREQ